MDDSFYNDNLFGLRLMLLQVSATSAIQRGDQLLLEARYAGSSINVEAILQDLLDSSPLTLSRFVQNGGDAEFHALIIIYSC